ncbi:glycosyltransferase family 2 protein [Bacillaceae bacterium C204]|uniref:glycosyltransferase family 2 protein n=1 Tax=Neobacillus sp. 204 TaxID=3383351 RepID=UPI00397C2BF8
MSVMDVNLNSPNDLKDETTLMEHPLVSVIVATYRRDTALEKALVSLMKQTYNHVEIVVVDDNAEEIWNQKVDDIICSVNNKFNRQIVYIKNKVNKGSAETRNIGIRIASGAYITFLDDDDIYLPNKIKRQVEYMIEANSDYCITDLDLYDESNRLIEKRNRKYIKKYSQDELLRYHLMYHMTGTDTMMFKNEYLFRIGGFPLINVGDEFYLMQKAIEGGGVFSYLSVCDIKAYVHTKTDGLSSGESKIKGEKTLYEYKMGYFDRLEPQNIRYIKMRHHAVLAFTEMRRENYFGFIKSAIIAFVSSPLSCIRLLINLQK